ncbi:anti-sigma factor domain-containing protein [uncultured Bradyrhizobium sp.]|uniref:anti-sigma factor n=1 Tax=uncultured Bradyrhizobium sp. TaxID=199684 RepID=UPI0035CB9A93
MAYSEDHIALAAEYALGTLDAEERAQVEAMMSDDTDFAAMVDAWAHKLGVLNQMVGSVEPSAEVWDRIKAAAGLSGTQMPLVLPEAPAPAVEPAAVESAPVAETSNVVAFSGQTRRWRTIATAMTAVAAALTAIVVTQIVRPDLLPDSIRPPPRTQVVQMPAQPAAAPAQYTAVLQKDGGSPAFILTVDGATRNFTVRKVSNTAAEPGKSYELWVISDRLGAPRSLGVIGDGDFTTRPTLASYDPNIVKTATYAVTVEPSGGSPNGKPGSPPVFAGKLIETVPQANR